MSYKVTIQDRILHLFPPLLPWNASYMGCWDVPGYKCHNMSTYSGQCLRYGRACAYVFMRNALSLFESISQTAHIARDVRPARLKLEICYRSLNSGWGCALLHFHFSTDDMLFIRNKNKEFIHSFIFRLSTIGMLACLAPGLYSNQDETFSN